MLLTLPPSLSPSAADPFTFSAPSPLSTPLTFTPPLPPDALSKNNLKRQRPLHDIDDSTTGASRKKRRLRLLLITSRLSRPFSTPASHIVNRGNCKVAVWARQKHLGSGRLRKIAILNSVRKNVACISPNQRPVVGAPYGFLPWSSSSMYPSDETAKPAADDGRDIGGGGDVNSTWPGMMVPLLATATARPEVQSPRPPPAARRSSFEEDKAPHLAAHPSANTLFYHLSIPPSPLGLSNYDALDEEDSYPGYCIPSDEDEEEAYLPHPDWASPAPPSPPHPLPSQSDLTPTPALPSPNPAFVQLPPSPSPSPPKSESPEQEAMVLADAPVISPNFAAVWKPLDEKRPPSPPDEGLLKAFREREKIPQVREGGVWTGFG